MKAEIADAVKVLERLQGPCDGGADEHSWRKCKRCLTWAAIENRDPKMLRLLTVAIETLKRG